MELDAGRFAGVEEGKRGAWISAFFVAHRAHVDEQLSVDALDPGLFAAAVCNHVDGFGTWPRGLAAVCVIFDGGSTDEPHADPLEMDDFFRRGCLEAVPGDVVCERPVQFGPLSSSGSAVPPRFAEEPAVPWSANELDAMVYEEFDHRTGRGASAHEVTHREDSLDIHFVNAFQDGVECGMIAVNPCEKSDRQQTKNTGKPHFFESLASLCACRLGS